MDGIHSQSSIDRFDHYNRPPSRDSSVDRYARATGRLSISSRQPSVDKTMPSQDTQDRSVRAGSQLRAGTPVSSNAVTGNGVIKTGVGANTPVYNVPMSKNAPTQPFEDILLSKKSLGQDIIPSPAQPKRTESLYVSPARGGGGGGGGGGGAAVKVSLL